MRAGARPYLGPRPAPASRRRIGIHGFRPQRDDRQGVSLALDYVSKPGIVGQLVFYGLFGGFAIAALVTGVVAVVTGRHGRDHTLRVGLLAIGYVVLAQTIQSLWD